MIRNIPSAQDFSTVIGLVCLVNVFDTPSEADALDKLFDVKPTLSLNIAVCLVD